MPNIDDRVVSMSFDNAKFENAIAQTMASLSKFDSTLQQVGKGSSFADIGKQANAVDLSGLNNQVENTSRHFDAMRFAAIIAFGTIVHRATNVGLNLVKSLSIAPVMDGFHNYETQINAVQTILANTGLKGAAGLNQVNVALSDLNHYANLTIYNFSEMAKNIGTFTAAGVALKPATESIKGIANLAALSGSSSQQASMAMYQLSQAIAAGTVHLQDWNSVVNAGMGGQVFQKALFNTAKAMGTLKDVPISETFEQWKKAGNSFRQSLSQTAKSGAKDADVLKQAQQDAARSVKKAQEDAAQSIVDADKRVTDAQQNVADVARQSAQDIATAQREQSDAVKQAASDVANALQGVKDARKKLAEAMKPPSKDELQAAADKLKTSQLDQADLADAVTLAQRDQTRAAEDLAAAQKNLADLQTSGKATPDQIQAAQRAVEDATQRVTDAEDAQTRALLEQRAAAREVDQAHKDLQATREKGTKKDAAVKTAQDALTQALETYKNTQVKAQQSIADAAIHVADVQRKSSENQQKAGQQLADAEQQQAKTIRDAQQSIADAHRQAAEQIAAARKQMLGPTTAPKSWLTSDVLLNTLRQFTGDMTDAQLKAQGFTDAQIKSIQQTGKTATDAATKIKTMSQLTQALKEEVASAWSAIFKTVFGDINGATKLFSSLHTTIENALTNPIYAFNKVLVGWTKMGGRATFFKGLKQAMLDLKAIWDPIKAAFREIFPPATARGLTDMSNKFANLMDKLKIGPETAKNLKDTFKGLFAVLDIGWQIIKGVGIAIGTMLGAMGHGSGGILKFTGGIGDFVASLDQALKKSQAFHDFFVGLGHILSIPIHLLGVLGSLLGDLFGGGKTANVDGLAKSVDGVSKALTPLEKAGRTLSRVWDGFLNALSNVEQKVGQFFPSLVDAFRGVVDKIKGVFGVSSWDSVFKGIQTGLIGGIFLVIRNALKGGLKLDVGGGLVENISNMFKTLTGHLQTMQKQVKVNMLFKIAAALALLAASIIALSLIDPKRLASAMTAVAVGLGELVGAMALLQRMGTGGMLQVPIMAASLILLAAAVDTLAIAVFAFSRLSWGDLIKGLVGVAGVLVAVAAGVRLMPTGQLIAAGIGLVPLAIGINGLAIAVKVFSTMKWGDMVKGLIGVAGALTVVALGISAMPLGGLVIGGAGLVLVSAGLVVLSGALRSFGSMDLVTMAKGLGGIATSLVVIGAAISAIPPTSILQGAALIVLGAGLTALATAIAVMGNLNVSTIAKGIIAIGAALLVLAVGLDAMSGSLLGAAALAAAAAGLDLLVPALGLMGSLSWGTIIKGLAAIGASMLIIGAAGTIAGPGMALVGAGLIAIGLGLAAIGGAVWLTAKGISLLSNDGQKGLMQLGLAIVAFTALLPTMATNFLQGLVVMLGGVVALAPKIATALVAVINSLLDGIVQITPKLLIAMGGLIDMLVVLIAQKAPDLITAGWNLLLSFLQGISNNIGQVVPVVANIITTFLTELANEAPSLVAAGVKALVGFLTGIANNLQKVVTSVASIITTFINSIASHIPDMIRSGANILINWVNGVAGQLPRVITAGVNLVLKFLQGIGDQIGPIERRGVWLVGKFLDAMANGVRNLADKLGRFILNVLDVLDAAIQKYDPQIVSKGLQIGQHLIEGMVKGIWDFGGVLRKAIEKVFHLLPGWARDVLGIHSPSRVFATIGTQMMEGITVGVGHGYVPAKKKIEGVAKGIVWTFKEAIKKEDPFKDLFESGTLNPKITPVVDASGVVTELDKATANLKWFKDLKAAGGIVSDQTIAGWQRIIDALTNDPNSPLAPGNQQQGGGIATWELNYTQNNYSPKSLTPAEVYRQTNNQLSTVKGALGLAPVPGTLAGASA